MSEKKSKIIVSWAITHKCNEKCGYCFAPEVASELGEVEHDEIQKKLIMYEITGCYFTGGEALLVPHLPKLIATAHNSCIDTRLNTNGYLLTHEKFKELAPHLSQIAMPFDSLNDDLNEKVRGNRLHRQTISSKIIMIKKGVSNIRVEINTCVNKQNIYGLEELGTFLQEQGIDRWKIRRFYPIIGNAKNNREQFEISDEEFNAALQMVKETFPQFNIDKKEQADLALRLMISPQGDLYRMPKIGETEDHVYGNMIKDDLDIIRIAITEKSQ